MDMTPQTFDRLMARCNGDRKLASVTLAVSEAAVNTIIASTPELARWRQDGDEAWTKPECALQARTIPTFDEAFDAPSDNAATVAAGNDAAALTVAFGSIGLSPSEARLAIGLQQVSANHFKEAFEMTVGGAAKTSAMLASQLDEISKRLNVVRKVLDDLGEVSDDIRTAWVQEEQGLMSQFIEASAQLQKTGSMFFSGAAVLAKIRNGKKEKGEGKPSYTPTPNK